MARLGAICSCLSVIPSNRASPSSTVPVEQEKWMKVDNYRDLRRQCERPGVYQIGQKRPFWIFGVKMLYIGQSTKSVRNRLDSHLDNTDGQHVGRYLAKRQGWGSYRVWLRPWALRVRVRFCSKPRKMEHKLLSNFKSNNKDALPLLNMKMESGNENKWKRVRRQLRRAQSGSLILLVTVTLATYVYWKMKILD